MRKPFYFIHFRSAMAKQFERTLEAVTDQTIVEPDLSGIMDCIDMVRGRDVSTKDAMMIISKRLNHPNPHVVLHTLNLLESCMKNCGSKFQQDIISRDFLYQLKEIVIATSLPKVREKLLEMIQVWHGAFSNKPGFGAINDVHQLLKHMGYEFPAARESDAMFSAQCAPDWADGDECYRCRAEFGIFVRRHHCRACGQIFCDKCSSHQIILPQFGIERKVRVCDTCFEDDIKKANCATTAAPNFSMNDEKQKNKELEEKEEEELQLALALSQSEAEAKEKTRCNWSIYKPVVKESEEVLGTNHTNPESNVNESSIYKGAATYEDRLDNITNDPEYARFFKRGYWESKLNEDNQIDFNITKANAPPQSDVSIHSGRTLGTATPLQNEPWNDNIGYINNETSPQIVLQENELAATKKFCDSVQDRVNVMENRMRSNMLRNRSIVNDSAINALFLQLTETHGEVMMRISQLENQRAHYEQLQDHCDQIRELRQAVDDLRAEHQRQQRELQLAREMERHQRLQSQREAARQKNQAMVVMQKQVALQRFQENEQRLAYRHVQAPGGMPPPTTMDSNRYLPNQLNYAYSQPYDQQVYNQNPHQAFLPPMGSTTSEIPQHGAPVANTLPFQNQEHMTYGSGGYENTNNATLRNAYDHGSM